MFYLVGIGILALCSYLGYLYKNNNKIASLVNESEKGLVHFMINFSPLIFTVAPFAMDFLEALNIAPFSEEYMHIKQENMFLMIVFILSMSSLMGLIGIHKLQNVRNYEKKIIIDKEGNKKIAMGYVTSWSSLLIFATCAIVLIACQIWVLNLGYTVHVLPHMEDPYEYQFGLARYNLQKIYVGLNVSISIFNAYWTIHLDARAEKEKEIADVESGKTANDKKDKEDKNQDKKKDKDKEEKNKNIGAPGPDDSGKN